jgi:hypothetical protein
MAEQSVSAFGLSLLDQVSSAVNSEKASTSPFQSQVTYYKMQAACTTAPNGYITWVNTTGGSSGRPACAGTLGADVQVASWVV